MDLYERLRTVGRKLGPDRWVITLGEAAPGSPRLLAHTVLEIGHLGGELSFECAADPSPRPGAWWSALEGQLDEYLGAPNDPATLRLVAHVVAALAPSGGDPALARRIEGRLRPPSSETRAAA